MNGDVVNFLFSDEFLMLLFMYAFPVLTAIFGIVLVFIVSLMPKPARTLFASRFKKGVTLNLKFFDNGMTRIVPEKNHPQGFGIDKKGKMTFYSRRQSPSQINRGVKKVNMENKLEGETEVKELERKVVEEYNEMVTRRFILEGVNKPVVISYSGIKQAVNASTLLTLEDIELSRDKSQLLDQKLYTRLLNPLILHELLPGNYSGDQIGGLEQWCIEKGRRLADKKDLKIYIMMMAMMVGLGFMLGMILGPMIPTPQ